VAKRLYWMHCASHLTYCATSRALLKTFRKTAISIPSIRAGDVERLVGDRAGTRRRNNTLAINLAKGNEIG